MNRSFSLLTYFLISCISLSFSQKIEVSTDIDQFFLEENTFVFKTEDKELTVDNIANSDWQKLPTSTNFGMVDKIHWIKYEFNNSSSQEIELFFYLPYHHIRDMTLFFSSNNDTVEIGKYGTENSFTNKEKQTPGYVKTLRFPEGNSTLFIKIEHLNIPLRASSYLLSENRLNEVLESSESSFSIWRIIILLAIFISLVVYLFTKIKIFLYYLMLNLGVILFFGMDIGEFFLLFNSDPYHLIIDIKHLGDIFILIFFPLFLNELTPLKKLNPKAWNVVMKLTYIGFALWAIGLIPAIKETQFFYYSVWFLIVQTAIMLFSQLYFLIVAAIKKEKNSLLLLSIYLIYIFTGIYEILLPNIGLKSDSIDVFDMLLKSSMMEIIIFMILMGKEMLTIFKDRNNLLIEQKQLQQDMLKAVVTSQEKERNTLGRELHDMIGANMSVVKQNIDKSNSGLVKIMDDTIDSVRSLSHGLMTPKVEGDQLKDEIIDLCLLCSNDSFKVNYYFHDWEPLINKENSTHLYRIIQELLQNTLKHSGADEAYLQVIRNKNKVTLLFEDNGIGFNTEKERKRGKGLLGIEHRTEILKGNLRYDSSSKGSSVELNFEVKLI